MKRFLSIFTGLWFVLGAASVAAQSETEVAEQSVGQLQQRLEDMNTLKGEFTQTLFDADGTLLEQSEGSFALQRPGKFYWHTLNPFEQVLVSDGETIWLYDPDLEQVTVRDFERETRGTPAMILSDDAENLAEDFQVRKETGDSDETRFVLTPKSPDGLFKDLVLVFDDRQLREIRMQDNLDQTSIFTLSELERNQPIERGKFQFEAPEGVDVLVD